jgi:hypothetical protein
MKLFSWKFAGRLYAFGMCVFLLAALAGSGEAQTTRKKRTSKTAHPAPVVAPQTEPEIVSRAADYQGEPAETSPEPTATPTPDIETDRDRQLSDLSGRIRSLESGRKNEYDEKQKRLLLNLDILTKAEQRSESLRKQRFDLIEKEGQIRTKLDQVESDIRPEMVDRSVALMGTLRPEELRDARRKSLEVERKNLQALLAEIQATRATLDQSVTRSDLLVERLRTKLEADIEKALDDDDKEKQD